MPFERLKAIVFADLRDRGASPARMEEYSLAWAASAVPGARAPMPCPACFAKGMLAALKGRSVADGYAAAVCSHCNITFQFSKGPKRPSPTVATSASVAEAATITAPFPHDHRSTGAL